MSQDVRLRILDAAIRLLEREGPLAFRQAGVAKEAGIEQGHLTYYFPKRQDLAAAVLERVVELQQQAAAAVVLAGSEGTPRERALGVVKRTVKDGRRTRILLSFALSASDGEADVVKAQMRKSRDTQRLSVAAMFGRDPDDPEVELACAAMRGLSLDQAMAPKSSKHVDELIEVLAAWLGRSR